jgi:hypothetical protein
MMASSQSGASRPIAAALLIRLHTTFPIRATPGVVTRVAAGAVVRVVAGAALKEYTPQ